MDEDLYQDRMAAVLEAIHSLLVRSVEIQEEDTEIERSIRDLEEKRTETTSGLLGYAADNHVMAAQRTDMSKEQTGLVREQTRLSTKSTELANIRTEFSRERSSLASQRTDLAVLRSDLSRSRTNLADQRTRMAGSRTQLSEKRTDLAGARTVLSNMRTTLARGRTYLALIRTGLAFLTLSIGLFRFFGVSWWSLFDGALALGSLAMTTAGLTGYWNSTRLLKTIERRLAIEDATAG